MSLISKNNNEVKFCFVPCPDNIQCDCRDRVMNGKSLLEMDIERLNKKQEPNYDYDDKVIGHFSDDYNTSSNDDWNGGIKHFQD